MAQLTQPKGMVSKETNKEAIARVFGLKKRQVSYLSTSTTVDSYTILYDEDTQTCWYRGSATGTPTSWSISGSILTLHTSMGTYSLVKGSPESAIYTIEALRLIDPISINDRKLVDKNGIDYWYYDPYDTITADNGIFCITTSNGYKWKREGSQEYINVSWYGTLQGQDISNAWQNAIDTIHTLAISQSSMYNLPYIKIEGGRYLLSNTVTIPPYISTVFTKDTLLIADSILDNTNEAVITIYSNDAINLYDNSRSSSFPKSISCAAGKIRLIRSGVRALTNPVGLYTKGATATSHAINMRISDLEVYGAFRAGHWNTSTRTWLMRFDNCMFNGYYGIAYSGTNTDSGERITYNNCVISGGYGDATTKALYINTTGINLHFLSCSFDFTGGDVVYLTANAPWCSISFEDSHIENWNGYLVNSEQASSVARFITFRSTNILPNGAMGYAQSVSRKLLNGYSCKVLFDDSFISWTVVPYDSYDSICVDETSMVVRVKNHRDLAFGLHPFSTKNRLNKTYDFSTETPGRVLTSSSGTTTTTTIRAFRNNVSGATAVISAVDNSLIDTSLGSGTTNVLSLTWTTGAYVYVESVEKIRVQPGKDYGMKASVVMPDLTSGLNIVPAIAWYDESDTYLSVSTVFQSDMRAIVNTTITGISDYLSRSNKRVACRTSPVTAPPGAAYGRAVIQATAGTAGSVYYLTSYNLFNSPTN